MEVASPLLPLRSFSPQRTSTATPSTRTTSIPRLRWGGGAHTVMRRRINAVLPVEGATTDLAPVQITWQIVVGALAGVAPFVVAGIEFSKRIIAQRKCEVCGGSGLVLKVKDKTYARCPSCGGFLPWQSWKRFFTG